MIQIDNLCFGYHSPLIRDLTARFPDGQITGILGPNGCGKTTLLKLCARLLRPASGSISVDGSGDTRDSKAFARALAYLPQSRPLPMITVRSLAAHGRFPHLGMSRKLSGEDRAAIDRALTMTGMADHAHRELRTLSGGQRQKAYIAMLIAQQSRHLILDEPMTHLDILHQLELMDILRQLRTEGRCIAVVLHDIAQAVELCDRILLIDNGQPLYNGPANGLYASGMIEQAFHVKPTPGSAVSFRRL